jgi:hypothetical protein
MRIGTGLMRVGGSYFWVLVGAVGFFYWFHIFRVPSRLQFYHDIVHPINEIGFSGSKAFLVVEGARTSSDVRKRAAHANAGGAVARLTDLR